MKTRNGFVSNSSSSSFIVAIPSKFELTDEMLSKYIIDDLFQGESSAITKEFSYLKKFGCINQFSNNSYQVILKICQDNKFVIRKIVKDSGVEEIMNLFADGTEWNKEEKETLLKLAKEEG